MDRIVNGRLRNFFTHVCAMVFTREHYGDGHGHAAIRSSREGGFQNHERARAARQCAAPAAVLVPSERAVGKCAAHVRRSQRWPVNIAMGNHLKMPCKMTKLWVGGSVTDLFSVIPTGVSLLQWCTPHLPRGSLTMLYTKVDLPHVLPVLVLQMTILVGCDLMPRISVCHAHRHKLQAGIRSTAEKLA